MATGQRPKCLKMLITCDLDKRGHCFVQEAGSGTVSKSTEDSMPRLWGRFLPSYGLVRVGHVLQHTCVRDLYIN